MEYHRDHYLLQLMAFDRSLYLLLLQVFQALISQRHWILRLKQVWMHQRSSHLSQMRTLQYHPLIHLLCQLVLNPPRNYSVSPPLTWVLNWKEQPRLVLRLKLHTIMRQHLFGHLTTNYSFQSNLHQSLSFLPSCSSAQIDFEVLLQPLKTLFLVWNDHLKQIRIDLLHSKTYRYFHLSWRHLVLLNNTYHSQSHKHHHLLHRQSCTT